MLTEGTNQPTTGYSTSLHCSRQVNAKLGQVK